MTHERGFTLIEALIAFAILAVVLIALYEAMGTGLKSFGRAAEVDEALLVAQSQLDRLAAMKTITSEPLRGSVKGTPFHWRAVFLPDAQPEPEHLRVAPVRLHKVRLFVMWRDGGADRQIAIDKMLLVQRAVGG